MSEENKDMHCKAIHHRRFVEEVVNQGNLDVIEKLFTADYVDPVPAG
jgi:hypothetical protein